MADVTQTGLKVAGAGLPRSSTLSLKTALEQLGFGPCYHVMSHVLPYGQHAQWARICDEEDKPKRQQMLQKLYEGNKEYADVLAAVDGPTCFFVDDFLEMYPDVKIVLSVRDSPEAWLKSFLNSVGRGMGRPPVYFLAYWAPGFTAVFHLGDGFNRLCKRRYGVDVRSTELYERHIEWVKAKIPADRLLIHNAKEGWAPLCNFLDCPVPSTPYPRVNDNDSMQKRIRGYLIQGLLGWLLIGTTLAGLILARRRWLPMMREYL